MKTYQWTFFSVFFLFFNVLNATVLSGPSIKFGAELSQSPLSLSMMHYNKNQWKVDAHISDYKNITNPVVRGLFAEYKLASYAVFTRFGLCNMSYTERSSVKTRLNAQEIHNEYSTALKQHQLLFGIGVKRSHTFNKISLGFGLEIPFVYHSTGELTETYHHRRYYASSQNLNYEFRSIDMYAMPSGLTGGLGAMLDLSYMPFRHIEFGFSLGTGIYRQLINKSIELTVRTENKSYNQDGTVYGAASGLDAYTLNSDLKHTFFSRVMPAIRVVYVLR